MERFVIDRLRESLADRVLTAADGDYDAARMTFNANVQRRPAVIVRVRTDDDVIAAVVAANDLGLPIAVRGGGHSVAGHAMAEGALVIDLRDRREVEVDPARRLVRAGGGALWEDVDPAAWAHHLAVVGGTFGDTGVGGLALGGGIGWLSGLQGFTCDNLVRAELVTASGEKVVAAPESDGDGDPDLLWALRGGGGNFGVVTSFTFRAIDPGSILAGYITYPFSAVKQVMRRVAEVAATASDALELTVVVGPAAGAGGGADDDIFVRVGVCWPGDPDLAREVLRPLVTALPALTDDLRLMEYPEIQAMSGTLPFGLRHYWKGHFLRALDEPVIGGVVDAIAARPGGHSMLLFEAIRGAARQEPDGGAAFSQRHATWNGSALAIWDDPAQDDAQVIWARYAAERLEVGSLNGAGYANYAPYDETNERVRLSFGNDNFARLAKIKARYDPGNRFRFNLNIAPG